MRDMTGSRRDFLFASAMASLAPLHAESQMPTRLLGSTGARVSALAFGCGSRWLAYKTPDQAIPALHKALDLGVTYVDTAQGYGNGQSESWVGEALVGRRDKVFLVTKVGARDADGAARMIEGSLKRLKADYVDLLHIHSLTSEQDLIAAEAGVLKVLYKLRDQKVARNIGITCHTNPEVLKMALERNDFNSTQMALNAGRLGMVDGMPRSFEQIALPVALKKKMGVTAMKVFAQEKLLGETSIENLVRYSMSLPVASAVCGMPKLEHIDQNIAIAKAFRPMPRLEMDQLTNQIAEHKKLAIVDFFHDHQDA